MATVFDVARYILNKKGRMTTAKLQKLVYYCQAWSLVWDEEPIFDEKIEAWANGPVVPALFRHHKGRFFIASRDIQNGKTRNLTKSEKKTIDAVLSHYGDKTAQWLIDLTHLEDPWKNARYDCSPGDRCDREISHADMMDYYSGL
ncbi:MAG: Panacea domain-containing protein [Desulfobacterales bacterium]